jgi:hypothetical protein
MEYYEISGRNVLFQLKGTVSAQGIAAKPEYFQTYYMDKDNLVVLHLKILSASSTT